MKGVFTRTAPGKRYISVERLDHSSCRFSEIISPQVRVIRHPEHVSTFEYRPSLEFYSLLLPIYIDIVCNVQDILLERDVFYKKTNL